MDTTLGQLAVHYDLITEEELEHCLSLQEVTDPPAFLGEIMVQHGYLRQSTLDRLLGTQKKMHHEGDPTSGRFPHVEVADRLGRGNLSEFFRVQVELDADDLHLAAGARPCARIHGVMQRLNPTLLSAERVEALLRPILDDTQREALRRDKSALFLHTEEGVGRFRAAVYEQAGGLGAVFRRIHEELPRLETLNLPPIVKKVPQIRRGLVLVTGPRGSGKTTTLATIIDQINHTRRCHVVMLERPTEYVVQSRASMVSQREVGRDAPDFKSALRSALREDPDVIVLGELATPEQIMTALTAAETGHLVLGTLHTTNAYRTLVRIQDAYSGRKRVMVRGMLANLLKLVICQRLVPSKQGDRLWLAAEVLTVTSAVANMIRENRVHQIPQAMQTSRAESMQLMDDALAALVLDGKIDAAEAVSLADDRSKLLKLEG
ncbi:MAG: PilT/PilU family type 4a pilus ATPase [Planctomycetes bacterium]|nr:PilT/PilU family type 4a pilus ATPase [Planctomycetota bacterium]